MLKTDSTSENCYIDADICSNEDKPQKVESNMNTLDEKNEEEIENQDNPHRDSLNNETIAVRRSTPVHRKPRRNSRYVVLISTSIDENSRSFYEEISGCDSSIWKDYMNFGMVPNTRTIVQRTSGPNVAFTDK